MLARAITHALVGLEPRRVEVEADVREQGLPAFVIVGLPDPSARVEVSPAELVATERTLCGSYMGSAVPARDLPWLFESHRAGRLPVERLVGERLE